jgi:AraC-like DNA-binding protein
VLRITSLARTAGFSISAVTCSDDHRGWSAAEPRGSYGLVLVRDGRFRRLAEGVATDVDPTLGYLSVPGVAERFAHPVAGGDVCTWITLTQELWRDLAGDARPVAPVYVDARLELAHRRLLAATHDPGYAAAESLLAAVVLAIRRAVSGPVPASPGGRDRAMVAAAREAIMAEHPAAAGLVSLAGMLGVSPFRLSRAFPRELGVSLTRYRNRVRVGRVLDRLRGGQDNLADLAAELGFADQAHLCRTVRDHVGRTPTEVRGLLRG